MQKKYVLRVLNHSLCDEAYPTAKVSLVYLVFFSIFRLLKCISWLSDVEHFTCSLPKWPVLIFLVVWNNTLQARQWTVSAFFHFRDLFLSMQLEVPVIQVMKPKISLYGVRFLYFKDMIQFGNIMQICGFTKHLCVSMIANAILVLYKQFNKHGHFLVLLSVVLRFANETKLKKNIHYLWAMLYSCLFVCKWLMFLL